SDIIASAVGCPCRIVRYSERTSTNSRSVIVSGAIQIADSKPSGVGSSAVGYSVVHVDDIEPSGPGGAVRFVRRARGGEACGVDWLELPPSRAGREQDETASGEEEVNVIVRGSGVYRVDGEEIPIRVGSFLRFDPGTTRQPVAGPDGMTMIGIGSPPGSYSP